MGLSAIDSEKTFTDEQIMQTSQEDTSTKKRGIFSRIGGRLGRTADSLTPKELSDKIGGDFFAKAGSSVGGVADFSPSQMMTDFVRQKLQSRRSLPTEDIGGQISQEEAMSIRGLDDETAKMSGMSPEQLEKAKGGLSLAINDLMANALSEIGIDPEKMMPMLSTTFKDDEQLPAIYKASIGQDETIEPEEQKQQKSFLSMFASGAGKFADLLTPKGISDKIGPDFFERQGSNLDQIPPKLGKVLGGAIDFANPTGISDMIGGDFFANQGENIGQQLSTAPLKLIESLMPSGLSEIFKFSPTTKEKEESLQQKKAKESTNGITISNEKSKGSLVEKNDEILLLPVRLNESFEAFGVITDKFINSFNPIVEQLDNTVTRLENLPALQIQLDTRVGPVEVILNGASLLKSFEESIQNKILAAIAEQFNRMSPDIAGNQKDPELYSSPRMRS